MNKRATMILWFLVICFLLFVFKNIKKKEIFHIKTFRWNMSSKHVNPNNNNLSIENSVDNTNQKSASCAIAHHLSSSHHVRHHSYDTTSNTIAAQIFPPSRSNRKENNLNQTNTTNYPSRFLPPRSSHRHTSSFASDGSSFTDLNSNAYQSTQFFSITRKSTM